MGNSRLAPCLQGGGIYVNTGTVSIVNSQVYSNQATYVRAHAFKSSHRPHGKLTFCSFFAGRWCLCQRWCLCRGWHSVNRELPDLLQHSCLCARSSSKVPIAPMGKLLTCLPRLTLAQLRPKLRSTIQYVRAAETLKTSQCPDGKVADVLATTHACTTAAKIRSTTECTCRRDLENFPMPRWEIHVLVIVCRAAVSMSLPARS